VPRRSDEQPKRQASTSPVNRPYVCTISTHTFASHLIVDLKLDVAHVSPILGHARPSITLDTYTHLFDQAAHAADIRERMATSSFGELLAITPLSPHTSTEDHLGLRVPRVVACPAVAEAHAGTVTAGRAEGGGARVLLKLKRRAYSA